MQPIALYQKKSIFAPIFTSSKPGISNIAEFSIEYSFLIKTVLVLVITKIICIFAD